MLATRVTLPVKPHESTAPDENTHHTTLRSVNNRRLYGEMTRLLSTTKNTQQQQMQTPLKCNPLRVPMGATMDCAARLRAAKSPSEPKITRPRPMIHLLRGSTGSTHIHTMRLRTTSNTQLCACGRVTCDSPAQHTQRETS